MSYEIRAMSFGEILDAGFQLLRDHFVLLVGTAAVLYVPAAVLNAYLGAWFQDPGQGEVGAAIAAVVGLLVLGGIASPIVQVAVTYAVGEVYLDRHATIAGSLKFGLSILLPLAGTAILLYCVVGLLPVIGGGIIAGAIAGTGYLLDMAGLMYVGVGVGVAVAAGLVVYAVLSLLLVWQLMVLERVFGLVALRRSRALMRGHLMRGLGVMAVSSLVVLLLVGAVGFVLGFVPWLGPLGSGIGQAAGAAYGSAVGVALYFDLRCRKEAFEVEHLARQVAAVAPPPPP